MTERYGWDQTPTPDLGLDISKAPEDIQKLYKWIIEKMYGKDVASAYGQAMVLTGILAKNAEAMSLFTSGRMDSLTTYVDAMMLEMTNKDIISAPELIAARDGEVDISTRLTRDLAVVDDIGHNVKRFGAVGDGVTDDGPALKLAHEWANTNAKKLWYPPGTYYIRDASQIEIQYDVDASQATIVVDTDIHPNYSVYRITSKLTPITISTGLSSLVINKNTTRLPFFGGYGDALVRVQNTNRRVNIRYGASPNAGAFQSDRFVVDNLGNLKNDVVWDFDTITNAVIYPIDQNYITVLFGKWIYNNLLEGDQYISRNIAVLRSRTKLSVGEEICRPIAALVHFNGLISTGLCYDVEIFDTALEVKPARLNSNGVPVGTYGLLATETVSLTYRNVRSVAIPEQYTSWGIMGGNLLKDFKMIESDLNRVDSHQGTHNVLIDRSVVGSWGVHLTGTGLLHIRDSTILRAQNVVSLRQDYGATWEGKILIQRVKHKPAPGATPYLVHGNVVYTHDFGHACHFGTEIEIDGYTVYENGSETYPLLCVPDRTITDKINSYYLPKIITVRDVRTDSGAKKIVLFDIAHYNKLSAPADGSYARVGLNNELDTNIDVYLDDGDWLDTADMIGLRISPLDDYTLGAINLRPRMPYFHITLTNISKLYLSPSAKPIKFTIFNSSLRRFYGANGGGSRGLVEMVGGEINTRYSNYGDYSIRADGVNGVFTGVYIKPPRGADGSILTDPISIRKAHEFISWGYGTYVITIGGHFNGCTLDARYPLSDLMSDPTTYGLSSRLVPSYGAHYKKSGDTYHRPISLSWLPLPIGHRYFDTTLKKPVFYTGTGWVDSAGVTA